MNAESPAYQRIQEAIRTHAGALDLRDCGLRDDSPELRLLKDCTFLEKLELGNVLPEWADNTPRHRRNQFSMVPHELPESLKVLSVGNAAVENIDGLVSLTGLSELDLSRNRITELSPLQSLTGLSDLNLSRNQITELSPLQNLTGLSTLDLSSNRITELSLLQSLTKLSTLDLSSNQITELSSLQSLTGLSSLNLSDNEMTDLSPLQSLTGLSTLTLSDNEITDLSPLQGLARLSTLTLSLNEITDLSPLQSLTGLSSLDLWGNEINDLSPLQSLTGLSTLDLSLNEITGLSPLQSLTGLSSLDLSHNEITGLSPLQSLIGLSTLKLSGNRITDLSPLQSLTGLATLKLSGNEITDLSPLQSLTGLSELDLSGNQIIELSPVQSLTGLATLNLSSNQITELAPLQTMSSLMEADLRRNPIRNFPQALSSESNCLPHYRAWLEELKAGQEKSNQSRMLLLGNGNVGKSTLLEALRRPDGVCRTPQDSTHAIVLEQWVHPASGYEYQVWDFGGQEIFFGTHRLFIHGQCMVLVLFDPDTQARPTAPDRVEDSETAPNKDVLQWIDFVRAASPGSPVLVVQTKWVSGTLPDARMAAYCREHDRRLVHVDSMTGRNIDEVQFHIQKLSKEALWEYDLEMPKSWADVRRYFQAEQRKLRPDRFTMSRAELYGLFREYGVGDYAHEALRTYLHNSGIIYDQPGHLGDTVIYDLRWVLQGIYKPFERGTFFYRLLRRANQGFVEYADLLREWRDAGLERHAALFLQFMQSCGICFPLNKQEEGRRDLAPEDYLVFPEFLPREPPQAVANYLVGQEGRFEKNTLQLAYLPSHLMQGLIARYGPYTHKQHYWYNGILLCDNRRFLLAEADREAHSLHLSFEPGADEVWVSEVLKALPGEQLREQKEAILTRYRKASAGGEEEAPPAPAAAGEQQATLAGTPVRNERPFRIAISYAKEDREVCEALVKALKIKHPLFSVFWDWGINENDWRRQVAKEFEESDLLIVLNSDCYNYREKEFIWEVEMPIATRKLKDPHLSVLRIDVHQCTMRDQMGDINDFKMGPVPKDRDARAAFFRKLIDEIIIGKAVAHWREAQ